MKIFLKFDFNTICNKVVKDVLEKNNLNYKIIGFGEIDIEKSSDKINIETLSDALDVYGIEIVQNRKTILVQKIKDCIIQMIFNAEEDINVKSSVYLSEKLNHSYGYLANLFSEVTYTSIENFIILQKIEYTKHLIINENLSLTEIAFKLNYSSVAHLSAQFKKTTGITPSSFQRIIAKRNELKNTRL